MSQHENSHVGVSRIKVHTYILIYLHNYIHKYMNIRKYTRLHTYIYTYTDVRARKEP